MTDRQTMPRTITETARGGNGASGGNGAKDNAHAEAGFLAQLLENGQAHWSDEVRAPTLSSEYRSYSTILAPQQTRAPGKTGFCGLHHDPRSKKLKTTA